MTCAVAVSIKNNQIFIVKENILNDALCATFLIKGLLFQNLSADSDAPLFSQPPGKVDVERKYPQIFRNCKGRKDKTKHL